MAELLEVHDRARFEVHGVSIGTDDRSDIRARIVRAVDQFHDLGGRGDREVATLLQELDIDILVDLGGYTEGARPAIMAYRPAAIQVSYIGFLGTMWTGFIDYLIGDETVIPPAEEAFYSERIDLAMAPAFRALIVHRPGGDSLLLSLHHTITDGVGTLRFVHSIARAYANVYVVEPHSYTLSYSGIPFAEPSAPQRIRVRNDGTPPQKSDKILGN